MCRSATLIFLSVAVSWAEAIGAGAVYIGAVAEDSSGYPDCRAEYYQVFQDVWCEWGRGRRRRSKLPQPVITLKKKRRLSGAVSIWAHRCI